MMSLPDDAHDTAQLYKKSALYLSLEVICLWTDVLDHKSSTSS